jgi:hypothetical protein
MRFTTTTAVPFSPVTAGPADVAWTPAISLDCTQVYVRIPGMGLWMPPTDYTLEFWCFATGGGPTAAFSMSDDEGGSNRVLAHLPWIDGRLYFDSGAWAATGRLATPVGPTFRYQWHHLALQVDSQAPAMRMFLDGQLHAATTATDTYKPRPVDFLIGHSHLGQLGEFRLWNYVRTPAEIQADMPRVLASSRPGLLGCWRLDDTLDNGGRIRDYSGYARHGSLNHR